MRKREGIRRVGRSPSMSLHAAPVPPVHGGAVAVGAARARLRLGCIKYLLHADSIIVRLPVSVSVNREFGLGLVATSLVPRVRDLRVGRVLGRRTVHAAHPGVAPDWLPLHVRGLRVAAHNLVRGHVLRALVHRLTRERVGRGWTVASHEWHWTVRYACVACVHARASHDSAWATVGEARGRAVLAMVLHGRAILVMVSIWRAMMPIIFAR